MGSDFDGRGTTRTGRKCEPYTAASTTVRVGDKVWLALRNVRTTRQSKKLDWKNAKYTVIEVVGSHSYRLNTPTGIHNVFHSNLLRTASTDPLESQVLDDIQPNPIIVEDDEEYQIENLSATGSYGEGAVTRSNT